MFLDSSRYFRTRTAEVTTGDGRTVKAVTLRRLPSPGSVPLTVKGNDRLDVIAQRRYANPSMFWHVADVNTELEANALVAETGRTIQVPEN